MNWVITDGPSNATASSVLAAISGRLAGIRMGSNRRRWRVIWTHAPDDVEIRISQRQQSAGRLHGPSGSQRMSSVSLGSTLASA